jgi:hypothetical protein
VTFAGGGCAAIARIDADSFEEAAAHILMRVGGRKVKSIEITDLRYEDEEADRAVA